MGSENIRMTQLAIPKEGIKGYKGTLNVFKFGIFFLILIAAECRII